MKSVVRPELSTAAAGSSQAPTAAVDDSGLFLTTRSPLINRGNLFKQPEPLLRRSTRWSTRCACTLCSPAR